MTYTREDYEITVDMLADMVNSACPPSQEILHALETLRKYRGNIPSAAPPANVTMVRLRFFGKDANDPVGDATHPNMWENVVEDMTGEDPYGVRIPVGAKFLQISTHPSIFV